MRHLIVLFFIILGIACNQPENKGTDQNLWLFDPSQNSPISDNLCSPIIKDYQELLKSLVKNDTADLFAKAKLFIFDLDSLPTHFNATNAIPFTHFKNNIIHIQDELQGLILEQYPEELNMSMNMVSIQILHLLGSIGYKKQTIYIFNTNGNRSTLEEDGLLWLSENKKSINPYLSNSNELVMANYILQEN